MRSVTPFAGVWIEIDIYLLPSDSPPVTPFAGVWIEMLNALLISRVDLSLPSRECGLKYPCENG